MNYIALTGKKRSGKDKSALILKEELGYESIAFADSLKDAMIGVDLRGVAVRERELYIPDGKPDTRDLDLKIGIYDVLEYVEKVLTVLEIDIPQETIINVLEKYDYFSFRRLMQIIGTDLVQSVDLEYWVKAAQFKIQSTQAPGVIFTDVRFNHEVSYLRGIKCPIINIDRGVKALDTHISENVDIPFDIQIANDGTLQDLEYNLLSVINKLNNQESYNENIQRVVSQNSRNL